MQPTALTAMSKEVLLSTAEKVLGTERKTMQHWVTNEVLNPCERRRHLRQQEYTSSEPGLEYRNMDEVRKKMRAAK